MLYAVRLTLSADEWEQAVQEVRDELVPYKNRIESLPAMKLAELLQLTIRRAVARHHQWLAEHQISVVISPDESGEGTFIFYFDSKKEATAFKRAFSGTENPIRAFKEDSSSESPRA